MYAWHMLYVAFDTSECNQPHRSCHLPTSVHFVFLNYAATINAAHMVVLTKFSQATRCHRRPPPQTTDDNYTVEQEDVETTGPSMRAAVGM